MIIPVNHVAASPQLFASKFRDELSSDAGIDVGVVVDASVVVDAGVAVGADVIVDVGFAVDVDVAKEVDVKINGICKFTYFLE